MTLASSGLPIDPQSRITASQARDILGIRPSRIWNWKSRRKLVVRGKLGGHDLFRAGDLADLENSAIERGLVRA